VCFDDPNGVSKEYGPECAAKAIQALNEKEMGENKLYLRHAMKKADREAEKKKEALKYKSSKKRCNLYVKNFPVHWVEIQISQLFSKYGEIEKIRVDKSQNGPAFAFVCFKIPDAAASARMNLNGQNFEGKTLVINHYEIKEIRQVQMEEAIDKADFEKYKAQETGAFKWTDLQGHPNLAVIVQQLLELMHHPENRGGHQRY